MYKQLGKIDLLINFLSSRSTKKVAPKPRNSLKLLLLLNSKYVILSITFLCYIHGIYISNFFLGFGYKPCLDMVRDHSYITSALFQNFCTPSPLRKHVFSNENKQKLTFSDPPFPPTNAYVIYKWSLNKYGLVRIYVKRQLTSYIFLAITINKECL